MMSAREPLVTRPLAAAAQPPVFADRSDPLSPWFLAAEDLGEHVGLRFGQLPPGRSAPRWDFRSCVEFDGVGAFADILQHQGARLLRLPQLRHPARASLWRVLHGWARFAVPRPAFTWDALEGALEKASPNQPPPAIAWHAFDEENTFAIRSFCRRQSISVTPFLLKHLTRTVRLWLIDQSVLVPWLIPINLRGRLTRERDTSNHTSFLQLRVSAYDNPRDIQKQLHRALARGEHWAVWYALSMGRYLGLKARRSLLESEWCTSGRFLGAFGNLGEWDCERQIATIAPHAAWLFCPPVFRFQQFASGALTFQNRLSLTIQAHPELTTSSNTLWQWMQAWVKEIQFDLASR